MIVTGWRVALELTLGTAALGLLVAVGIWLKTGVFGLLFGTEPLLEQLVFWAVIFSASFAFIWLMAWQRIELNEDAGILRFSSIVTGYRWRTSNAKDIAKARYYCHRQSLGQVILSSLAETRALVILEDSMFATRPSRFLKKIAGFVRAHNPNAEIAAVLTDSSA